MWLRFAAVIESSGIVHSCAGPVVVQNERPLLRCRCCSVVGVNRLGGVCDSNGRFFWWCDLCSACTEEFYRTWNMVGRPTIDVRFRIAPRMKVLSMMHDSGTKCSPFSDKGHCNCCLNSARCARRLELNRNFIVLCAPCEETGRKMYGAFVSRQKNRAVVRWCAVVYFGLGRDVTGCVMRSLWAVMMDESELLDAYVDL